MKQARNFLNSFQLLVPILIAYNCSLLSIKRPVRRKKGEEKYVMKELGKEDLYLFPHNNNTQHYIRK
jgi:hypothetical protein